jgi:hypothetical protein
MVKKMNSLKYIIRASVTFTKIRTAALKVGSSKKKIYNKKERDQFLRLRNKKVRTKKVISKTIFRNSINLLSKVMNIVTRDFLPQHLNIFKKLN